MQDRCRSFLRGEWTRLYRPAELQQRVQADVTEERAAKDAAKLAFQGELKRACLLYTSDAADE